MSATVSSPPPFPPAIPATPKTSGTAIASMVLGILAPFTVITSIPAVITGHIALGAVKRSEGLLVGRGMAIAGLVLGYLGIGVLILILAGLVAPLVIRSSNRSIQTVMAANMRQIHLALLGWADEHGTLPKDAKEFYQMESADHIPDMDRLLAVGRSPAGNWKYYPAANASTDPLLISPPFSQGKKILILRADGSVQSRENIPANSPPAPVVLPGPHE